ncbi:hypothetical protein [Paraburkholderia hospita]|uniref:hypothetical protein n=1 Tax=Paraburkholderia hospita TaxID=169430 RepID=UPI0009A8A429|nr:hypothetical protein [Paraburkholderia hospita]SKC69605.1 hypothetical protein SAMN05446934_1969 [Paraburkholderia hospita]
MSRHVDLFRTFTRPREQPEEDDDWTTYLDVKHGRLTWSDLREKRIVVVVGEAGIGKTTEFRDETRRLRTQGQAAFFVELSQLAMSDSWALALGQSDSAFETWQQSTEVGYFFLDAVDEARLTSHAALKKALRVVHANLRENFSRVRVAISSRWTDWSIDDVQATVKELLAAPIDRASRVLEPAVSNLPQGHSAPPSFDKSTAAESVEIFVASLAPLSILEAQKLARAWGVPNENEFWTAISDGEYEHLATRPLDLNWMVKYWTGKRSLGTYRELIEGSVANRLQETNPSYQASGALLSPAQLREGAELLAAATELSGRGYISCEPSAPIRESEIAPREVLDGWSGLELTRLLASALFDEATFARVKFHHRTTRAYLAASWIDRELQDGVPLHRVLPLFVATPFGESVLIPARRWALCWLAAINANARDWVARHFPEMLLFDGDPESWDTLSADAAFRSYVRRRNDGYRPDWYNDGAEFMRVGKRLSRGLIASYLSDAELATHAKVSLLPIVVHARLTDCATAVFNLFSDSNASSQEQLLALDALDAIATPEQCAALKTKLLSASFTSNEFIAAALAAVGTESLTATELTQIFTMTGSEEEYGHGPMASVISRDLLPTTTVQSAGALLEAVVASLPAQNEASEFNKYHGPKPPRAWILDVLPACLERLVSILDIATEKYPAACLEATVCVEMLRNTWYSDHDLKSIHDQIAGRPSLRWQLATTFMQSARVSHLTTRMCWSGCLVSFDATDLHALTLRANDEHFPPAEREFWFDTAKEVAMGCLARRARKDALAALAVGPDHAVRAGRIAADLAARASAQMQQRQWKANQRHREHDKLAQKERHKEQVKAELVHVRDASHMGTLCWLVQYSYDHAGRNDIFRVEYGAIARDLSAEVAEALAAGLKKVWRTFEPPTPADCANGTVPWEVILALAGLYTALKEGEDIGAFSQSDAAKAARLAVWELKRPPDWFDRLVAGNGPAVEGALQSWIAREARQDHATSHTRRALDLALHCRGPVRARLLQPLVSVVLSRQITSPGTFKELFDALREDGLIPPDTAEELCTTLLAETRNIDGLLSDPHWLRVWLEQNPRHALTWFEDNLATDDATAKKQVRQFVETLSDFKWIRMPADDSTVYVLMQLHALVSRHRSAEDMASDKAKDDWFAPSMTRMLETIPGILVRTPGIAAHQALLKLLSLEAEPATKAWLQGRMQEHAAFEASLTPRFDAGDLYSLGEPLHHEPRSERELFEQVLSRLDEVRIGIEQGPFSDRGLFHVRMSEKLLQLWLAARFRDTPNRRFTVHREEEVDDDKETDIQLSSHSWNVCIEIKPVDHRRGYSAASLTRTLREQLVGQYLKGFNSGHGILVLFQLDNKEWDIPGVGKGQSIQALVEYLQGQAQVIKGEQPHVQELIVFAIDCTLPGASAESAVLVSKRAAMNETTEAVGTTAPTPHGNAETARETAVRKRPTSKRRVTSEGKGSNIMAISDLWNSPDESGWVNTLNCYWSFVRPENMALEHAMDELNIERLRNLDSYSWYAFLRDEYFRWKYTAPNRYATTTRQLRRYLDDGSLDELDAVRQALLSVDQNDVRTGLTTARRIRGLGTAGASGLLALMYPATFATVDQFVVVSLREVKDLPETHALQQMKPEGLTVRDGVTLIDIMQRKARELNRQFRTTGWTPRKIDMILWSSRQRH